VRIKLEGCDMKHQRLLTAVGLRCYCTRYLSLKLLYYFRKKKRQASYEEHNNEARSLNHSIIGNNNYYVFRVCVCSLRYPSCKEHAPYCHLCPVRLYHIFPHYLTNRTIFGKKLLNTKCVLIFFIKNCLKHFSR
jgi:hypothetical protein